MKRIIDVILIIATYTVGILAEKLKNFGQTRNSQRLDD